MYDKYFLILFSLIRWSVSGAMRNYLSVVTAHVELALLMYLRSANSTGVVTACE